MNMTPIANSSNVKAVGYDEDTKTLRVEFLKGGVYDYIGVPESEHSALMSSSSVGSYIARNIKGKYESRKVA